MPNVRKIYAGAFAGAAFTKIVFPERLEYIGHNSFAGCRHLKYIELSKSLKYIDDGAFLGCASLDTVKVHFTQPIQMGASVFQNIRPNCSIRKITLSVPAGCKQAFEQSEDWKHFDPIIEH